jgi:hypothetical protein
MLASHRRICLSLPKTFELLNWDHVQEKTREMRQSGCLARKCLHGLGRHPCRTTLLVPCCTGEQLTVKARFRAQISSRARIIVLLWASPDSWNGFGLSLVKRVWTAGQQRRATHPKYNPERLRAQKNNSFGACGGFRAPNTARDRLLTLSKAAESESRTGTMVRLLPTFDLPRFVLS